MTTSSVSGGRAAQAHTHGTWAGGRRAVPMWGRHAWVQTWAHCLYGEQLGAAVDGEEQPARSRWTCLKLTVDVADVRSTHNGDIDAART